MKNSCVENNTWTEVIRPCSNIVDLNLTEVWRYRDLVFMLIRRDFVTIFKQTILGPFWYIFPIFATSITYLIIFSKVAKLSTDGIPPLLFYISGLICWNLFSGCFTDCSKIFQTNSSLFAKVYFPRLVVPIAKVISNYLKLVIQLVLFAIVYLYYKLDGSYLTPHLSLIIIPVYFISLSLIGSAIGIIVSAITVKYRDLGFLVGLFTRLLMYLTPIIYPLSMIHGKLRYIMLLNPLTSLIEGFKFGCLGTGSWSALGIIYSCIFTIVILFLGVSVFNKVQKNFIDTV